jgi:hypothetical protein
LGQRLARQRPTLLTGRTAICTNSNLKNRRRGLRLIPDYPAPSRRPNDRSLGLKLATDRQAGANRERERERLLQA